MSFEPPAHPDLLASEIREALPAGAHEAHAALGRLLEVATRNEESCAICYQAAKHEGRAEATGDPYLWEPGT